MAGTMNPRHYSYQERLPYELTCESAGALGCALSEIAHHVAGWSTE